MPPSPDPKTGSDDGAGSRPNDAALRKKKNADAQAAFRARRANYIATLEETVTNLESVVLSLQESRRTTDKELGEARQENQRLRRELEHKESLLKMYEKKVDREPPDDYPMPSYAPIRTPPVTMPPSMSAGPSHYADDAMRYANGSNPAAPMNNSSYHNGTQDYPQRSPAMGYVPVPGGSEPRSMDPHSRMPRYDPYQPYPIDTSGRDGGWVAHSGTAVSDPGSMDNSSATHSPTFVESPTLTASDLSYPPRYGGVVDEQKVPLTPLSSSSYMFAPSRSLSPAASTPSSTSSTSLAPASYPFTFPEGTSLQDRPEFYRRPPELTLHGGTADISSIVRMSSGRASASSAAAASSTGDRSLVQAPSPYARTDNGSHDRGESDGESSSYTYGSRPRTRPVSVSRGSRSPSPGPAPICGTLAVIKAQAFGALRRTRGRSKKTTEGAAKAAVEALAARGIGVVANPAKRPRLHDSDGDLRI
ncbi:hypothetical protein C8Q79DRAFT_935139 [Trametes meyenii]|nr:hypothetical protein C8Q79DRAFT_935139 [Trametes meyenii]